MVWGQLHRQTFSPVELLSGEILNRSPQILIENRIKDPAPSIQFLIGYANMNVRIGVDVLYPVRLMPVFSENVDVAVVNDEPYLDGAAQPTDPAHSSQVEHFSGIKLAKISHSKSPPITPNRDKGLIFL